VIVHNTGQVTVINTSADFSQHELSFCPVGSAGWGRWDHHCCLWTAPWASAVAGADQRYWFCVPAWLPPLITCRGLN